MELLRGYMYNEREEDEGPGRGARLGERDRLLRDELDGNIDLSSFAVLCLSFWRYWSESGCGSMGKWRAAGSKVREGAGAGGVSESVIAILWL
jgi:hypothetical protein